MIESGDYRVYLDESYTILKSNGMRYEPESNISFVSPYIRDEDFRPFTSEEFE